MRKRQRLEMGAQPDKTWLAQGYSDYIFFSAGFDALGMAGAVMLLVTLLAPQLLAILVAAPLLPAFWAVPVSVASPLLTVVLNPCDLSFSELANLSEMHF